MKKVWLGIAVVAMGISACNFTVGECWPNGQGGSAEVGPGAVGAVGVGGYGDTPPRGGTGANACNASSDSPSDKGASGEGASPPAPPGDGSEMSTYIRCRGLGPAACEDACASVGAYCAALAVHPYGSMAGGNGQLKQCQSNTANYTCTYCFPNGDVCSRTKLALMPPFWLCNYTGGKGCD